jgi:hypothetical protein
MIKQIITEYRSGELMSYEVGKLNIKEIKDCSFLTGFNPCFDVIYMDGSKIRFFNVVCIYYGKE